MQADCTHIQTHEGQSQGNAMKKNNKWRN